MSDLYLVATPIGNLEDITYRAIRILNEVPLIAAEDTRTTKILLDRYQIDTSLTSYHDHNKERKTADLLKHLKNHDLALVSDAGTPAINDPGLYLVKAALAAGHQVVPIPGPSAPIAALSASGQATDSFLYLGYLPRKKKSRRDILEIICELPYTMVCLETPHRLVEALKDMDDVLGKREISIARELTKLHEEIFRGSIREALDHYEKTPPKGEITLVVAGKVKGDKWDQKRLLAQIKKRIDTRKVSPSRLAKELAKESGWSRRDIYDLIQGLLGREEKSKE
jgi:16S rRNA (cytidine1402-2'-O)-methyltransferase